MSRVAVVVPSRDRPRALEHCLLALRRQSLEGLELVVVDDGSRDAAAVRELAGRFPGLRLVRTRGLGLGAARNLGVAATEGEIVLFTDDDCLPEPEWAARLAQAIEAGLDAAAGRTLPPASPSRYQRASEVVSAFARARLGVLVGNNCAARRSVLVAEPFAESSPVPAGEDREWSERLRRHGYRLGRSDDALVRHCPDLTLAGYLRQQVRYGRGSAWLVTRRPSRRRREPLRFYASLLAGGFRSGPLTGSLVLLGQVATAYGRLRGLAGRGRIP